MAVIDVTHLWAILKVLVVHEETLRAFYFGLSDFKNVTKIECICEFQVDWRLLQKQEVDY